MSLTNKEQVLFVHQWAEVCEGDSKGSRVIISRGEAISDEFPVHPLDENGAEEDAWADAARKIMEWACCYMECGDVEGLLNEGRSKLPERSKIEGEKS